MVYVSAHKGFNHLAYEFLTRLCAIRLLHLTSAQLYGRHSKFACGKYYVM